MDATNLPTVEELYQRAPCGLILTSTDGTLRIVNDTYCQLVGRRREDLIDLVQFQSLLSVGSRIFHQTHWHPLLQMQGSVAEVKLEILHADGHKIPVVVNAIRRQHGDAVLHEISLIIAEDRDRYERELMSARKQSDAALERERVTQEALALAKARLRLALHSANLYVWEVDPESGERTLDDDIVQLLGEPEPRPISAAQFSAAMHPDDAAREAAMFESALKSKPHEYACTYRLVLPDGSQRTVFGTGRGIADPNGQLVRFVGVLQDVTEVTVQRAASEDRAVFAEQMMGIVSHDLRNPLSAVALSAQVLERMSPTATQLSVLQRIRQSTSRAQRLINTLLDFTQARLGRGLSVVPRELVLHDIVSQAVTELRAAYPNREFRLETIGAGSVTGDGDRLAQALGNLVSNAVHYGDPTTAISIVSGVDAESFSLSVQNYGPVIPRELVAALFKPLQRGASERTDNAGIGLGLFIVQEIANAHRGTVRVESAEQTGTSFTLVIPNAHEVG